ncbi:ABC transporter ATP-binding protein [Roseibacillus persicicus]|uniref:ABC transporter ATP-binding protein n=1 Tax=Roseibacillus persicicus TaxID=454148 RepID=UPI00167BD615|nr:ABC transporter ATP-binding protein [Roseibacillus persicicus]
MFPHLRPLVGKFVLGLIAAVVFGIATGAGLPLLSRTALPVIFQDEQGLKEVPPLFLAVIEWLFGGDQQRLVLASCLFIPFVFLLRGVGGYLSAYWMTEVGTRAIESFRKEIFDRLLSHPMSFFGKRASGDILSRVIADTGSLQSTVTQTGGDIIKQPIVLISTLATLVVVAIQKEGVFFALVGGITIPILVFPIRALGKKLKKRGADLQAKVGEMTGMASEVIQNPLEVRAYNLEERFSGIFGNLARDWRRFQLKLVRYTKFLSPLVEVVAAIGFAFSLYLGAKKDMSFEDFMLVATALFLAYDPVKRLGNLYGILEQAKASMARVKVILDAEDSLPEPENPKLPPAAKGEVEFRDVRFSYGDEEVLTGVNARIESGQTVALVGESGGGKTTFANMIPRFYEVSSGSVIIDGVDVRDYSKRELRNRIALVPQMPVLFRGTIYENILMGRPDASEEEVHEAARKAFASEFIEKQEQGYQTMVSERGGSLSGGQRQRIAIARAFLKDAPILIMDEATSALDAESEARVQEAVSHLAKGRTTIFITHRPSTMEQADRVLEFNKGLVTERSSNG